MYGFYSKNYQTERQKRILLINAEEICLGQSIVNMSILQEFINPK